MNYCIFLCKELHVFWLQYNSSVVWVLTFSMGGHGFEAKLDHHSRSEKMVRSRACFSAQKIFSLCKYTFFSKSAVFMKLIKIIYSVVLFISHLLVRETSCACKFSLDIFSIILTVTINKYSK